MATQSLKLSNVVRVGSRFGRSVNIERDFDEQVSLNGYVLTTTARAALHRIAQAQLDASSSRAWTLTGPYGSGKSAFALFAAKALSTSSSDEAEIARQLLKGQDKELWHSFFDGRRKSALGHQGLCPVLVSGSREPLSKALLRGLENAIGRYWPSSPPLLLIEVRLALKAIEAGRPISGRRVVEMFEEMAHKVAASRKSGVGLLVVIDELGKLLEYAANYPANSDIFLLQELAEATKRGTNPPFFLITVLHQAFERYVERLDRSHKEEWIKVQGRFEDIAFQEPTEQVLRILGEAISHSGSGSDEQALNECGRTLSRKAWTIGLTPSSAKKTEVVELLGKCVPLHPTVALLLGYLFRRIGQNERSLFAFLSSHEPFGFQEYLSNTEWNGQKPELLRIDYLYDYVTTALGSALFAQADGKKWAEIESALNRAKDASKLEIRLIKAIGLLRIVGDIGTLKSSHAMLEFSLEDETINAGDVGQALDRLQQRSIIIYRRYNNAFSLWEGSDVDIEAKLKEARLHVDPNESLVQSLTKYFKPRPIVARRHSFETGTLRFFEVRYVDIASFDDALNESLGEADGLILCAIALNADELSAFAQKASDSMMKGYPQIMIAIPPETAGLREAIFEVASLRWTRDNTPELEGDRAARNELQARLANAESSVQRSLQLFFDASAISSSLPASRGCKWYRRGKQIKVNSDRALQEYVSEVCSEVFSHAPVLRNELINRRHLSSSAHAARRELISAMLHHGDERVLGIEGYPPHASMYFSLLQETGMHREENAWGFFPPKKGADGGTKAVWEAVDHFFADTEVERRTVSELFDLLGRPPFGLKSGSLPIILCAALLHYDTEMALYEQGTFVPSLSTAVFERLVKTPERFQMQRCRVAGVRAAIFRRFASVILQKPDNFFGENLNILSVVRPLSRFANTLPAYAKNTQRLSKTSVLVRAALFEAREPDHLLFANLPKACGLEPFIADDSRNLTDVDLFFKRLRGALAELQRAYVDLLTELEGLLIAAFSLRGTGADARKELKERAQPLLDLTVEPKLKAFIIRATDDGLELVSWIEAIATFLATKPPAAWHDSDLARFEVSLAEVARSFLHIELLSFELKKPESALSFSEHELMRLGVTTINEPERQRVVIITQQDRLLVETAENSVEQALEAAGLKNNMELRLAVLAKLSRKLLTQLEGGDHQKRIATPRKRRANA